MLHSCFKYYIMVAIATLKATAIRFNRLLTSRSCTCRSHLSPWSHPESLQWSIVSPSPRCENRGPGTGRSAAAAQVGGVADIWGTRIPGRGETWLTVEIVHRCALTVSSCVSRLHPGSNSGYWFAVCCLEAELSKPERGLVPENCNVTTGWNETSP